MARIEAQIARVSAVSATAPMAPCEDRHTRMSLWSLARPAICFTFTRCSMPATRQCVRGKDTADARIANASDVERFENTFDVHRPASHIPAVFTADVVERVADLAEGMRLHRFDQRVEQIVATTGGGLQFGQAVGGIVVT